MKILGIFLRKPFQCLIAQTDKPLLHIIYQFNASRDKQRCRQKQSWQGQLVVHPHEAAIICMRISMCFSSSICRNLAVRFAHQYSITCSQCGCWILSALVCLLDHSLLLFLIQWSDVGCQVFIQFWFHVQVLTAGCWKNNGANISIGLGIVSAVRGHYRQAAFGTSGFNLKEYSGNHGFLGRILL